MHKVLRMVLWKTCTSGSKAGDCVQIKLWRAESKHCTKEHSNSYFRTLKSNCKLGFQLKKNKNSFRLFAHVACSLLLAQPSACLLHLSEDGAQRTSEVPCDTSTPLSTSVVDLEAPQAAGSGLVRRSSGAQPPMQCGG